MRDTAHVTRRVARLRMRVFRANIDRVRLRVRKVTLFRGEWTGSRLLQSSEPLVFNDSSV